MIQLDTNEQYILTAAIKDREKNMFFKRNIIYTPKGKYRPLHIWLPDNYNQTDEHYPVMYFFDGHNLFRDEDATYGKSWGLDFRLQRDS